MFLAGNRRPLLRRNISYLTPGSLQQKEQKARAFFADHGAALVTVESRGSDLNGKAIRSSRQEASFGSVNRKSVHKGDKKKAQNQ